MKTRAIPYTLALLAALTVGAILAAGAAPVYAEGPTPYPTLRPLPVTPTLNYLYGHPTPTPIPVVAAPDGVTINPIDAGPSADMVINVYRYINHDHLIDLVAGGTLAVFSIYLMVNYINRRTNRDENE